jgi:hypothetical protein
MSALSIQVPFPVFQDRDGQPLDNGYIWIGVPNLNPQTNPVVAYYDEALTIVALQPLRTLNGYISRAGTPAQVYVDAVNFSILVQDSKGSMVYNFPDGTGISPNAAGVVYDPPFTVSVPTNVEAKLAQTVSVLDFGAAGNGTGNLATALQAAHDALGPDGGEILIPAATSYYLMSTGVTFTKSIRLVGDGWFSSEILTNTNGITLISTNSKLDVVNLHFTALSAARGTCRFILHQSTSANHGHSTIDNCFFDGALNCYYSQSTNAVVLNNSVFGAEGATGVAILLENLVNPDTGDSFITNNTISGASTVIGIQVNSTSGINICNNKFNNELAHVLVSAGANLMGNYLISNNSFEGHTDYAVKMIATSGTITKTLITGNQFSATSTNNIVLSNGAKNTTITGNTFNHTNAGLGTGVAIESGVENVTITGNAFHQIANGIVAATGAAVSAGITASGNRFANDVTTFFAGDDGLSNYAPQRELSYSRLISNASDTVYSDACKVQGYGTVEIKVYGIVQGVGVCNYYAKYLVSGSTPTQITAPVTSGASFNVQVAASAGYLVVSAKRATGIGTTLTAFVEVTTNGQITDFRKA